MEFPSTSGQGFSSAEWKQYAHSSITTQYCNAVVLCVQRNLVYQMTSVHHELMSDEPDV